MDVGANPRPRSETTVFRPVVALREVCWPWVKSLGMVYLFV